MNRRGKTTNKLPKPYYRTKDGMQTIYHGDSSELLPLFGSGSIDLVLTDPPYGINIVRNGKIGGTSKEISRWRGQINTKYMAIMNDDKPINPDQLRIISKNQIIFGGNYIADYLPPSSCWIVWYKRVNNQRNNFADCEMAWTSFDSPARVFQHLWMGMLRKSEIQEHYHPTQKPVQLMVWIVKNYSQPNDTILDPFLGSGSTLLACKKLNRKGIGIEIEEEYCEIAAKRLDAIHYADTHEGYKKEGLFF